MPDPTTQLAKEFLEFKNYTVRLLTKFYQKRTFLGTPSDIDIIAVSPTGAKVGSIKLKPQLVAEVKNYEILQRSTMKWIYDTKFRPINNPRISRRQLRYYIRGTRFDRVLFCLATTDELADYAQENFGIKVVTSSLMIKEMGQFFRNSKRNWSYYPESYNYNTIRGLMFHLYSSHRFKDPLLLEDLVWINPKKRADAAYRNKFVEMNSAFLGEFIYQDSHSLVLSNLIRRAMKDDPGWLKAQLRKNKSFWESLK